MKALEVLLRVQGWHNRKAVTNYGCTRQCVEDGADYALVVGRTVYILEGHGGELDKFAGGQATIRGRVNGNKILVDSVAAKQKKPSGTAANFLAAQAEQPSAEVSPKED